MKLLALLFAVAAANPILFVTQVPMDEDFTTIGSTFGNHSGQVDSVPRGGDLWIRYPDGSLKNLTRTAGFGMTGLQGAHAIAVRDPAVHWSGTKALFSMVIGAPDQYEWNEYSWQIYEITGLAKDDTPVIRRIANQPADYNNISPVYATDDRILFTTDRPRNGARHLYPQLDEYEEAPTVTGLWSLNEITGELKMLNHSPSGVFSPFVDSYGRVVFTRWDHLQRDQQADDAENGYGTFDFADESAGAARLDQRVEVFPEPRIAAAGSTVEGFTINHFFPWEINEDGTAEETLNHIGRHELHRYFNRSFNDDDALEEFIGDGRNTLLNLFQIEEDPTHPGRYIGTDAPEFDTHASGRIVRIDAPLGRPADEITVSYLTPEDQDRYRDPLPLANGSLLVVHDMRIKSVDLEPLTPGTSVNLSYWSPDVLVTHDGPLWEMSPVEVRSRTRPTARTTPLEEPEARVFREEGVNVDAFKADLKKKSLALVVSRDVTRRDEADRQQPFNLRVAGESAPLAGKSYEVAHMQFFEGQQVRGIGGVESPRPGRRVLARASSSVKVAPDGSVAALVPATRAMTWQTVDPAGTPVVRERYWLTFQPGEVRVCSSCHGVNTRDQLGQAPPAHSPEALRALLKAWKSE
ncbi:MAG: HzsA-related protein, partial [Thermoanaerobaculia bacterium]